MGDSDLDEKENVQSAREALHRSYSTKSAAHGTYILTAVVAIFTVFQVFPPASVEEPARLVLASVILGAMLTFIFQMGMRALYWGSMTAVVACVKPLEVKDMDSGMRGAVARGELRFTIMYRLEEASENVLRKTPFGKIAVNWVRRLKVWIGLSVIFCVSSCLTYGIWLLWTAL